MFRPVKCLAFTVVGIYFECASSSLGITLHYVRRVIYLS